MAWYSKVLYARALWYIPVGLIAIAIGISMLRNVPKKLESLHKMEGYVVDTMYRELTWPKTGMKPYCFIVSLDNNESAYINYDLDIIEETNIKEGDYCIIWTSIHETEQGQNNIIKAITVNEMPVIKFNVARWPFIIICIGLLWFIIPLIFVITKSEILLGNKKTLMKTTNNKL